MRFHPGQGLPSDKPSSEFTLVEISTGLRCVDLRDTEVDIESLAFLPRDFARRYRMVLYQRGDFLAYASARTTNTYWMDPFYFITPRPYFLNLAPWSQIEALLERARDPTPKQLLIHEEILAAEEKLEELWRPVLREEFHSRHEDRWEGFLDQVLEDAVSGGFPYIEIREVEKRGSLPPSVLTFSSGGGKPEAEYLTLPYAIGKGFRNILRYLSSMPLASENPTGSCFLRPWKGRQRLFFVSRGVRGDPKWTLEVTDIYPES